METFGTDEAIGQDDGRVGPDVDQLRSDEPRRDPAGEGRGPNSPRRRITTFGKVTAAFATATLALGGATVLPSATRRRPWP